MNKVIAQTQLLEISAADARLLYVAIEQLAYYERGAGREENAQRLWALFDKLQRLHFYRRVNT